MLDPVVEIILKDETERKKRFSCQQIRSYKYLAGKSLLFFNISFNYIYIEAVLYFEREYYRDSKY